jgi:hypothetical protein
MVCARTTGIGNRFSVDLRGLRQQRKPRIGQQPAYRTNARGALLAAPVHPGPGPWT